MGFFDNQSDDATGPTDTSSPLVAVDAQVDIDVGSVTGILDDCYAPGDCSAVAVNADICADPLINADVGACLDLGLPDISIPDPICGSDHTC